MIDKQLKKALRRAVMSVRDKREYGTLGRHNTGDDSWTVKSEVRDGWVIIHHENGNYIELPNTGNGSVPIRAGLRVQMIRKTNGKLVLDGLDDRYAEEDEHGPDDYGNTPHPFTSHTDVPDSYAGEAGSIPQVNGGETGLEFTTPTAIVEDGVSAATEQTVLATTDRFLMMVGGVLKWSTYATIRDSIKNYYDTVVATLTNKIIDASNNTLTNVNTSALSNDAVSNAKMANMAQATVKGRQAGAGTGDPEDLTPAQMQQILKLAQVLGDNGFVLVTDGTNGLIERQTTATGSGLRLVVDLRATSTGNVADGFGPAFFFSMKDIDGVANILGAIGAVRDGADNTGVMQLRAYIAGISTIIATAGQNGFSVVNALSAGGAVDFDSTLNVDGAATLNTATVKPGTATDTAKVSGLLFSSRAQVGNVGTGEDVLIDYSLAANSLSADNQSIRIYACGTFANNANTKRLRLRFGTGGTNLVLDTTALSGGAAENWELNATIMRTGAATQKGICRITVSDPTLLSPNFDQIGFVTTLNQTLSGAVTVRISGEATANNDILIEMCKIWWDGENT